MNNIIMDLEVRASQFVDECVSSDACIEQKTETKKGEVAVFCNNKKLNKKGK